MNQSLYEIIDIRMLSQGVMILKIRKCLNLVKIWFSIVRKTKMNSNLTTISYSSLTHRINMIQLFLEKDREIKIKRKHDTKLIDSWNSGRA